MKTVAPILLLLLGLALDLRAGEQTARELFFEANVRFAEEAYAEAVPLYEEALAQHPSPNIHYNLGLAFHRLGEIGRARVHWERAVAMDPGHAPARHRLQSLLAELDLRDPAPPAAARLAALLSLNQWIWLGSVSFWAVVLATLALRWRKSRWPAFPAALGLAGVFMAAAAVLLLRPALDDAIVLSEEPLLVAPASGSPTTAGVRPAQRVRIAGRYGDFVRVIVGDGKEGYVAAGQLEKIR